MSKQETVRDVCWVKLHENCDDIDHGERQLYDFPLERGSATKALGAVFTFHLKAASNGPVGHQS